MTEEIENAISPDQENSSITPDYSRFSALIKASFIAINVDLFLIIFKYLLSILSKNTLLLADALHSGGDLAVSIMVLISIIVHHSFHDSPKAKQAEAAAALLISLALIVTSTKMFWSVIFDKTDSYSLTYSVPVVISLAGISIVLGITLVVSRYKARIGKKHNSIAFVAEGYHTYSDFLTSFGVWVALFLGYFGIQFARVMSLLIAIAVFQVGIRLLVKFFRLFNFRVKVPSRVKVILTPDYRQKMKTFGKKIAQNLEEKNQSFIKLQKIPAEFILNAYQKVIIATTLLIILLYIGTGFYKVLPYQTGLEFRFGAVVEQNSAGPHFHLPEPVGRVVFVDTGVPIRLETGFRTNMKFQGKEPDVYLWEYTHQEGRYSKVAEEAIAISGDENLVDVNFLCYYRVTDAKQYALGVQNTHELLRAILTHKAHAVLGRLELDVLLTQGRNKAQEELYQKMKQEIDQLPLGVIIEKVYMQEAHPPIEVIPQYRAVTSAREKKSHIIHQAVAYKNDLLPRSRGKAISIVLDSQAYAAEKKKGAIGQTEHFLLRQKYFGQNCSIQKNRLKWKTIEDAIEEKPIYVIPSQAKRRIYLTKTY